MKYILPFIIASFLFIACNSNKEKTTTNISTTIDSPAINDALTPVDDPGNIAVADTTPVAASRLIVPGKSIGLTSIDQKNEDARKHLGPPASEDAGMGKELATWYSKPIVNGTDTVINQMNIFFVTNMGDENEASRVSHIRVTSSFFATSQHIRTGSARDSIQKYFPGTKKIGSYTSPKTKKQVLIYDDNKSGIAFEIDDKHSCVGITVHKPGQEAHETYNALFGNVNFD